MGKLTVILIASSLTLCAAHAVQAQNAPDAGQAPTGANAVQAQNAPDARHAQNAPPPVEKPMGKHHNKADHGLHRGMMLKGLNLTDVQKQKIDQILKDQHSQMPRPSQDEKRALHAVVASSSFDRAKAETLSDRAAARHKAHMLGRLETQHKIYQVLTPEQQKQYNANFEQHVTQGPKHKVKTPPHAH